MCHWQETDLDEPSDGEVPKPASSKKAEVVTPYAKIQLAAAKRAEAASKSKKEKKKETQNRLESVLFFCLSYWKV